MNREKIDWIKQIQITMLLNVVKFRGDRIVKVKFDFNEGSSKQANARRA